MADIAEDRPRVIALIDLSDLQWQVGRMGGVFGDDPAPVVRRLEAGLPGVQTAGSKVPPSLGVVYVYSRASGGPPKCWSCPGPCTGCQAGSKERGGRGHNNPIAQDLMVLAREDAYDWAVVVSADTWLGPVVRFIQSHGRKIIHGCFPPLAAELTKECWASIDLRPLASKPG